jgi:hypothetical protein
MLEYVFFGETPRRRFTALLDERGVAWSERPDSMAGSVVAFPDDLPDALLDEIESCYDELMARASADAEADPALVEKRVLGIAITLADGSAHTLRLDGAIGNLLLSRFAPEEAQRLVQAIARSLQDPQEGPLCHPRRAGRIE